MNIIRHAEEDPESRKRAERELTRLFRGRRVGRVLFITPPVTDAAAFDFDLARGGRYENFPPYGSGLLASGLAGVNIESRIVNLHHVLLETCQSAGPEAAPDYGKVVEQTLRGALEAFPPDLIALTCMFSKTHKSAMDLLALCRTLAPQIPIALGGVHLTTLLLDPHCLETVFEDYPGGDFFFLREADATFPDFLQVINGEKDANALASVVFNAPEVKLFFETFDPPRGRCLDTLPVYRLMDIPALSRRGRIGNFTWLLADGTCCATVLKNRGCRGQCAFCSVRTFNGPGVRMRSLAAVVEELKVLSGEYGVRHVMWLDDDFLYDRRSALELFNEIVRQRLPLTWDCSNGVVAASCTEELMRAAAESGCIGLMLGVESGNPDILRRIKKPGSVETFLRAATVLRGIEAINTRLFLMIGFPGETYRNIWDTYELARQMRMDWCGISFLQALPATRMADTMRAQEAVDFSTVQYHTRSADVFEHDIGNVFRQADMESVPGPVELEAVWAFMHYHLNFEPLQLEERPVKLRQHHRYLRYILDVLAPGNAFAAYYFGYLSCRLTGAVDPGALARATRILEERPYWQKRFSDAGLSISHLATGDFPPAIPRGPSASRTSGGRGPRRAAGTNEEG